MIHLQKVIFLLKEWGKGLPLPLFFRKQTYVIAGGVCVLAYVLVRTFHNAHPVAAPEKLPLVMVLSSQAVKQAPLLSVTGTARAMHMATLRAEVAGKVLEITTPKGSRVQKDDVLMRVLDDDRSAKLEEARAKFRHREAEYHSSMKLKEKDFTSKNALLSVQSEMETARAYLRRMEADFSNTSPKAPFSGYFHEHLVDVGDTVALGDKLAVVINDDKLKIICDVALAEHEKIDVEALPFIMIGSQKREGKIIYQARAADLKTRTYRFEIEIENHDHTLTDGAFCRVFLPCRTQNLHRFDANVLILNDEGKMGLMLLDAENKAHFHLAHIVEASDKGMLMAELPDHVRVITRGAQFIKDGQKVAVSG